MNPKQTQTSVSPQELHRIVLDGAPARLLDVRTAGEFDTVHVPGARLVPLDELNTTMFLKDHAPDAPVYVLCQSGMRARKAIEKFQRAGFHGCVLVEGGTQAWMDAGLPVNRGEGKVLPLMRQVQIVIGSVSGAGALLALTVNKWFALVPLITGCGLLFAGLTGFCGLAVLLARMPWNRGSKGGSSVAK